MSACLLAIDPGAAGGLAWIDASGVVQTAPMPCGMTAQADLLRGLARDLPGAVAVVEKTGTYRPGNSGPAAAKFARHCGHLECALYMAGLSTSEVAPGVWMRTLGSLPKDKGERKRAIREQIARRYPDLTVTLKTADALGILTWAIQQQPFSRSGEVPGHAGRSRATRNHITEGDTKCP